MDTPHGSGKRFGPTIVMSKVGLPSVGMRPLPRYAKTDPGETSWRASKPKVQDTAKLPRAIPKVPAGDHTILARKG